MISAYLTTNPCNVTVSGTVLKLICMFTEIRSRMLCHAYLLSGAGDT